MNNPLNTRIKKGILENMVNSDIMSTLAAFDDLRRCTNVLTDGTAEEGL